MLSLVSASLVAGGLISKTGHYYAWMVLGPLVFAPAGGAILYATTTPQTPSGLLIGAQILIGIGVGAALQVCVVLGRSLSHNRSLVQSRDPSKQSLVLTHVETCLYAKNTTIAVQAATHDRPELTAQAVGLVCFAQLLGGSICIAIAGSVHSTQIKTQLLARDIAPDIISAVLISVDNITVLTGNVRAVVLVRRIHPRNAYPPQPSLHLTPPPPRPLTRPLPFFPYLSGSLRMISGGLRQGSNLCLHYGRPRWDPRRRCWSHHQAA